MTILERIVAYKQKEVAARKYSISLSALKEFAHFKRTPASLVDSLKNSNNGIIAEHKRRSPSKSVINDKLDLQTVVSGYEEAGVAGISVLTDTPYFGGSMDDLLLARELVSLPMLRKDFMIDPYQVYEAKAYGADVILLIAACLDHKELRNLAKLANGLGLEVLLEVHNLEELQTAPIEDVQIIGVNNRNLKTFEVSIETSIELSKHIPASRLKISESGISDPKAVNLLKKNGYNGFLIGENFMRTMDPGKSATEFIAEIDG